MDHVVNSLKTWKNLDDVKLDTTTQNYTYKKTIRLKIDLRASTDIINILNTIYLACIFSNGQYETIDV